MIKKRMLSAAAAEGRFVMPKFTRDDMMRKLAENLCRVRPVASYLMNAKDIVKDDIHKIISNSNECKMVISFFPYNLYSNGRDVEGVLDALMLIGHTERALLSCNGSCEDCDFE